MTEFEKQPAELAESLRDLLLMAQALAVQLPAESATHGELTEALAAGALSAARLIAELERPNPKRR